MSRSRFRLFAPLYLILAALCAAGLPSLRAEPASVTGEAAQGTGVIAGQVFDAVQGTTLFGVRVEVEGTGLSAESDFTGRFRIPSVPTGSHVVILSKNGLQTLRVSEVAVKTGGVAPVNASLTVAAATADSQAPVAPDASLPAGLDQPVLLEAISISAEALRGGAAEFVALRQESVGAIDAISTDELTKFVATDVAAALIRLPGVSVSNAGGAQFAVIRGLSERYNPVMLDGIVLPSADPERQNPSLDIFPTRLMDGIVVSKTFEPRLPGFSSGGAIDLQTKAFPVERYAQLSTGIRFDEEVLGSDGFFLTYPTAGNGDSYAMGKGDRVKFPEPGTALLNEPDTVWSFRRKGLNPGYRFSGVYEDILPIGDSGRELGIVFSGGYDSKFSTEQGEKFSVEQPSFANGTLEGVRGSISTNRYIQSEEDVRLGAFGLIGLKLSSQHRLTASLFYSQSGNDEVEYAYDFANGQTLEDIRLFREQGTPQQIPFEQQLHYKERNLTSTRLGGNHFFDTLGGLRVDWAGALVKTSQDDPDYRFLSYSFDPTSGLFGLSIGSPERSPTRFWRESEETQKLGKLEVGGTFDALRMQGISWAVGTNIERAQRDFREVSGSLQLTGGSNAGSPPWFGLPNIDQTDESLSSGNALALAERRSSADASRDTDSGYASITLPVTSKVKLSGGVRLEDVTVDSGGFSFFGNASSADAYLAVPSGIYPQSLVLNPSARQAIAETLALPALLLTVSPTREFNVRAAVSQTYARPSFREIGPYFTRDETTDTLQHGNPSLRLSDVRNADLRFEYFFGGTDLVALGYFYKEIDNPIEKVGMRSVFLGDFETWTNNPGTAEIHGVELEARKNLSFVSDHLSAWTLGGNFSYMDASVPLIPGERDRKLLTYSPALPPERRRLYDQPEWIANADLTWSPEGKDLTATLSFFAISDVLQATRTETWDAYRAAHERVDFTLNKKFGEFWSVRVTASNLTDPRRELIADPSETADTIVYQTYRDGRSYSITVSRTF